MDHCISGQDTNKTDYVNKKPSLIKYFSSSPGFQPSEKFRPELAGRCIARISTNTEKANFKVTWKSFQNSLETGLNSVSSRC